MSMANASLHHSKLLPPVSTKIAALALGVFLSAFVVGCSSGPTAVRAPKVDPAEAAQAALERYDVDTDGKLNEEELTECPGLLEGISEYDKNDDGLIDSAEIEQRLQSLYSSGVGMLSLGCRVHLKGQPVPDCTVRLVPEEFLGDAVKPASGKTRSSGTAMLRISPSDLGPGLENVRGVHSGVYRVELSHPSKSVTKRIEKAGPFGFDVSVADQVTGLTVELSR